MFREVILRYVQPSSHYIRKNPAEAGLMLDGAYFFLRRRAKPRPARPRARSASVAGSGTLPFGGVLEKLPACRNTAESRIVSPVSAIASLIVCVPGARPVMLAMKASVKPSY